MKSQESAAGSKLVLRCEASSEYSSLRFKWFKNGSELNRKNKPQNVKIQKKPGKSELRISKASLADSGEYVCKVTSKLGNDSAAANITIVDTSEIATGMPASTQRAVVSSESPITILVSTEGANTSSSTSTSTTGTSHLVKCAEKEKTFCVNGGECFMVKDLSNPSRYLCKCPNEFTGDRCQNYVMTSFYKHLGIEFMEAEELYQKRVLTITGICIALLVVGIMCVAAYCKTKKQRKKLHDRLRQSLRSERNHMVNIANGPHRPHPPPENVQLVNQYVSKNVISGEPTVEREAETSFSTSHYTSTTHHSTTVTQTPSHSWSNGHTESHSVILMSSVENSRPSSPAGGPRGRLNGLGGPRECPSFLRHARETPDSYRDSPHSESQPLRGGGEATAAGDAAQATGQEAGPAALTARRLPPQPCPGEQQPAPQPPEGRGGRGVRDHAGVRASTGACPDACPGPPGQKNQAQRPCGQQIGSGRQQQLRGQ
ncbi:pro-neuregulin-1, membrane-bound isoform isoform X2 [Tupaia chinensis]|uniref:pro-neuregulin-1, membrane-bound isoform isoform X2 n=1 Tax=Tupaia chinensis TaxID=246437 RepID=UPI000FFBBB69|nr:pro-neuregulin-1, membrane-bound isoform isoform X2 [Tupaia chinensis]